MRHLTAVISVVMLTACGSTDGADAYRNGVPTPSTVSMKLPGSTQQPLEAQSTRRDGLEGDTALMYGFTRGATVLVNTGVSATLSLVEKIVSYPPTSLTADSATWGPVTDALSPNTWQLTVTRLGADQYRYSLQARAKTEPDSAFRELLTGTHSTTGDKLGAGSFTIDWDQAQTLPEHDANVGIAQLTYSKTSATDDITITAHFTNVHDGETGGLVSATYSYREVPGHGGSLDFTANKNFYAGPALEHLTARSRWQQDGAGRSDARSTGGDLSAPATLNECWDSGFASRYFFTSFSTSTNYGTETKCVFASPEYATQ